MALIMTICLAASGPMQTEAAEPEMVDVFVSGADGYNTFRIPSLISTPKGTLLAFCEGRKFNGIDESATDLVLKRSCDGGKTWLPMQVVVAADTAAATDPTLVVDRSTGAVLLVYEICPEREKIEGPIDYYDRKAGLGHDSITAWVTSSTDEGVTWSKPVDITAMTKKPEWTLIAHGPGVGIQTRSGRLVVPCWRTTPAGACLNFFTYSDDHGKTWKLSDNELPGVNENQVVELTDGTLMLNARGSSQGRKGSISKDGGRTWSELFEIPQLAGPRCQASILRYSWADQHDGKSRILFCNPGVPSDELTRGRHTGAICLSYDEGKTWPVAKVLNQHKSYFGYSCLTATPDGAIAVLYEGAGYANSTVPSKGYDPEKYHVTFASFSLEWLPEGKDSWKQ